jgi:diaminohydroxyphosphoribosylaminopyrimidine deaminase / 5-amino-6-(5-phosphoribosylamino)uracil reductase
MAAAIALSGRGRGSTWPNPSVGCIIINDGRVVGRGWTQPGGRPHAEAMAVAEAGAATHGATAYVTLEPCAEPGRGPACASVLIEAGIARVVVAADDPFPAVNGKGYAKLREAGIAIESSVCANDARRALSDFLTRQTLGRPFVTLKLATSLDGCIAMAHGSSRWITGEAARAHGHLERARHDAILVGAGTVRADNPTLDVRLPGLADRSPHRVLLGSGAAPEGWDVIRAPEQIADLKANSLLVEGGAQTAAAFLQAGLVDRLLLYRAPILIGGGKPCLSDIGLESLDTAHGRWALAGTRMLGNDRLEVYEAACLPA